MVCPAATDEPSAGEISVIIGVREIAHPVNRGFIDQVADRGLDHVGSFHRAEVGKPRDALIVGEFEPLAWVAADT